MEPYLLWIIAGFILVIVELLTGTFYLLVFGGGAFAGAAVAAAGGGYLLQAVGACGVALVGTWYVRRWHGTQQKAGEKSNLLDLGQRVVLEEWIDAATRRVRVKYRGASWDAILAPGPTPEPGAALYISGQEGNTLLVSGSPTPDQR